MRKLTLELLVLTVLFSFGCSGLNLMLSEEMLKAQDKLINNPVEG
jgi:hypothetical protein